MSPPTNFTPGILVGDQQIAGRTVPACLVENHHTPVVDVDHQGQLLPPHLALAFEDSLTRASVYGLRKNVYRGGCLPSLGMSIALSIRSRRRPNLAGPAAERCGELDSTGFHVVPDLFGRVAPASGAAQDGHDPHRLALEVLFGFTCRIQEMSRQQGCCDSPLRLSSGQSLARPTRLPASGRTGHRGKGAPGRPNSMAAPRTSPMPRPRSVPRWRSFYPRCTASASQRTGRPSIPAVTSSQRVLRR